MYHLWLVLLCSAFEFVFRKGGLKVNNSNYSSPNRASRRICPTFSSVLFEKFFPEAEIDNGGTFNVVTGLSRNIYKKLKIENYIPEERIAYTICISLGMSLGETCELLSLLNYSIIPADGDDVYREMLVKFIVNGVNYIPECNEELISAGFVDSKYLLGTVKRK